MSPSERDESRPAEVVHFGGDERPPGRVALALRRLGGRFRSQRAVAIGSAVLLGAAVLTAVVASDDGEDPDTRSARPEPTPPSSVSTPGFALPPAPAGLKLVGYGRVMLAVPQPWEQSAAPCAVDPGARVRYPTGPGRGPCDATSSQEAAVAFSSADGVDVRATSVRRIAGRRLLVGAPTRSAGVFVQYAVAPALDVAVRVQSPDRRILLALLRSIQAVPPQYVVVPAVLDLDPERAATVLRREALNGRIFADSSTSGLPEHVVRQTPSVGTVVAVDSVVNLGVIPR